MMQLAILPDLMLKISTLISFIVSTKVHDFVLKEHPTVLKHISVVIIRALYFTFN